MNDNSLPMKNDMMSNSVMMMMLAITDIMGWKRKKNKNRGYGR